MRKAPPTDLPFVLFHAILLPNRNLLEKQEMTDQSSRLRKQLDFILECEKLKGISRQTRSLCENRTENDAEHSWHLALMTMLLAEYAAPRVDPFRVMQMVLIHDIVEIDAGDTYCYDEAGRATQREREQAAAQRIFGLLPDDQAQQFHALFDEFNAGETAEAKFAAALDRFQPLYWDCLADGVSWRERHVTFQAILDRNKAIAEGCPALWELLLPRLEACREQGLFDAD